MSPFFLLFLNVPDFIERMVVSTNEILDTSLSSPFHVGLSRVCTFSFESITTKYLTTYINL